MSDQPRRSRDSDVEETERTSFIILQHVYGLADETEGSLRIGRVASDLALPVQRAVLIVRHLVHCGFLGWEGTGRPVRITQQGVEYIERLALRRRSLRVFPAPVAGAATG